MTNFLSLPPELREQIYLELLVDSSKNQDRIMLTLDKDGHFVWNRITQLSPPDDELITDDQPAPTPSSIKHLDYSNLWSLARVNSLLYAEATPIMYANANLEYTFGDSCFVDGNSVLLQTFLNKLRPATCALYRQMTIVNGKNLSAKAMRFIVNILNSKLPCVMSLSLRAIDPHTEVWLNNESPEWLKEHMQLMAAARPLSCLTSSPKISLKTRLCFCLDYNYFDPDPETQLIMLILRGLMETEVWRRQAQNDHAMNCEEGHYLQLTYALRSTMTETTNDETTTEDVEEIDDIEARLMEHQASMKQIEECKHWRMTMDGKLREMPS
ncbi:unnamed protein product [Aureobasidium mustum]|uniref:F-box domain-containing protein n=1 Tax=Aureobasidium mustum TaxID=2773714 RepID=A0A9N8P7P6_9PEZI|nr:unnamed protein product [Aureobasidium mustum]